MHVDAYTKAVLTVIALCLVWMCVNGTTPVAWAQGQGGTGAPTPVVLVNERGLPVISPSGLRVHLGAEPLPVVVDNTVTVAVRAIQRSGSWDPLVVHILREPPTLQPIP